MPTVCRSTSRMSALVARATWPRSQASDEPGRQSRRGKLWQISHLPRCIRAVLAWPQRKSFAVFLPRQVTLDPVYCTLAIEACRQNRNLLKARMYLRRRARPEKMNGVETVLEIPATDVALSELLSRLPFPDTGPQAFWSISHRCVPPRTASVPSARLVPRRLRPQTATHGHP